MATAFDPTEALTVALDCAGRIRRFNAACERLTPIPIEGAILALEIRPEGEGTLDRLRVMEPQPGRHRLRRN